MAKGEQSATGRPPPSGTWTISGDYYALNVSEETAGRLVEKIKAAAERVAKFPLTGSPRDRFLPGLRSVRAPPYLVFSRVSLGTIEVARVLHERRELEAAFAEGGLWTGAANPF